MDIILPIITFIVTCKGRLQHLKHSLPRLVAQKKSQTILVDFECPDGAGDWAEAEFKQVKVIRLKGGEFNVSKARNEGLANASTDWIGFVDADVVLTRDFAERVIDRISDGNFYMFEQVRSKIGSYGSCLVQRKDIIKIGGYDEAFRGWGGEDKDLFWRLEYLGINKIALSHEFLEDVINHSNELRTKFYAQQDYRLSQTASALYRLVKIHLMKINFDSLKDLSTRQKLFNTVYEAVLDASRSQNLKSEMLVEIPIREAVNFYNANVTQYLRFDISLKSNRPF
jgi:glycosyltransferase involved in cell wall biosynthesis